MSRSRRSVGWWASVLLLGLPLTASAAVQYETYKVNVSSFSSLFGGTSPARTIEFAANQWRSIVGGEMHFDFGGTTTDAGCGIGNSNHVHAVSGCKSGDSPACSTIATHFQCPLGGFEIKLYMGAASPGTYSLNPTASGEFDLQQIITHEFGHRRFTGNTHISSGTDTNCMMHPGVSAGNHKRWFCNSELYSSGLSYFGEHVRSLKTETSASGTFPAPGTSFTTGNFTPNPSYSYPAGIDAIRGLVGSGSGTMTSVFAGAGPTYAVAEVNRFPNPLSTPVVLPFESRVRPTLAYDPGRRKFWAFGRDRWADGPGDIVQWSHSTDPLTSGTWATPADVADSSGTTIATRVPVGAAYEPYSDRIVVVFARYSTSGVTSGELWYTSIPASTSGGTANAFSTPVRFTGESTVSIPSVTCENSTSSVNCEASFIGTDAGRKIWTFGFALNTNGSLFNKGSATGVGETDFAIGLTGPGPSNAGDFVSVHRGTNQGIFVRSKSSAGGTWSSWSSTSKSGRDGPPAAISESNSNYVFLNAP